MKSLFKQRLFSHGRLNCFDLNHYVDRAVSERAGMSDLQTWSCYFVSRPQKITLGELRASGVRGLLIYCSDYQCSHSIQISADQWADDVRLSDLEPRFVC
jgi:hypothetical protein